MRRPRRRPRRDLPAVHRPAQEHRTGLGLGLSIARKAITSHGGVINFHNMPGKGCVFVIELPLALEGIPMPEATVNAV